MTKNVKPGNWQVILTIKEEDKEKNAELICIHEESFNNNSDKEDLPDLVHGAAGRLALLATRSDKK